MQHALALLARTLKLSSRLQKTYHKKKPVRLELALPAGASLIGGKARQEIGHLQGRSNKMDVSYNGVSPTDNRGKAEWVVKAAEGTTLKLSAISERGGVVRRDVILGA